MTEREAKRGAEELKLNETELKYIGFLREEMTKARDMRDQKHDEFDGMTYLEYWESNAKAANSYIPPKINKQDVRTTSGTTHEKGVTILSAILNYNLEPDIEAFDDNDQKVAELGTIAEDLVKKSRKIEIPEFDYKRVFLYKELFDQGTVFAEDTQIEFSIPDKVADNFNFSELDKLTWTDRMSKVQRFCSAELLSGPDIYLGNFRQPFIELQPIVFRRKLRTRAEAQAMYGSWERWKNVPKQIVKFNEGDSDSLSFHDWTLEVLQKDMVEELKVYQKFSNNYMILLNGVPMFPVKMYKGNYSTFPLSSLTGECEYPLAHVILDPIPNCAYGKSIPAKTKVDQQLYDEMLKAVVLKTRKSYNPPMANNTGKSLSAKIHYPGNMVDNVNPDKLQEIGNNQGVTPSEFSALQFIKQIIDEKSVNPIMEGQAGEGQQTAREVIELKQQSMMKLGLSILAVVMLEKKMTWLRLMNILKYWTAPVDVRIDELKDGMEKKTNEYQTFTIDTSFEDGEEGQRIVKFTEELPSEDQVMAEEDVMHMVSGKKFRKNYLNPTVLRATRFHWYVEIVPTEKNTSALKVAQFEEFIGKAAQFGPLFGRQLNGDFVVNRWTLLHKEDPDRLWQPVSQIPMGMQGLPQVMPQQGSQMNAQLAPKQLPRPSVNSLVNQ